MIALTVVYPTDACDGWTVAVNVWHDAMMSTTLAPYEQATRKRSIVMGPVGKRVAATVREIRKRRGMSVRLLSERVTELGRPVLPSAITRIESGERRLDVDDLMALALALDVSPVTLMLPASTTCADDPVPVSSTMDLPWSVAWRWAHGEVSTSDTQATLDGLTAASRDIATVRDRQRIRQTLTENRPYELTPLREAAWQLDSRAAYDRPYRVCIEVFDSGEVGTSISSGAGFYQP